MICLLYDDVVCLASAGKADQIYTVQACLALGSIKTEEVDNGRGASSFYLPESAMEALTVSRIAMSHGAVLMEASLRM